MSKVTSNICSVIAPQMEHVLLAIYHAQQEHASTRSALEDVGCQARCTFTPPAERSESSGPVRQADATNRVVHRRQPRRTARSARSTLPRRRRATALSGSTARSWRSSCFGFASSTRFR
jgi:hypothetical protein